MRQPGNYGDIPVQCRYVLSFKNTPNHFARLIGALSVRSQLVVMSQHAERFPPSSMVFLNTFCAGIAACCEAMAMLAMIAFKKRSASRDLLKSSPDCLALSAGRALAASRRNTSRLEAVTDAIRVSRYIRVIRRSELRSVRDADEMRTKTEMRTVRGADEN